MRASLLIAAVALTVSQVAAQSGSAQAPGVTPQVAGAVARADKAIAELQTTLIGRLKSELGKGGPQAAVTVCRDEAQQLTASIGAKHALEMGRTSHRVRNPANAPRPWSSHYVASWAGARAAAAQPAVFELRAGRVGVLRPIGTMELCVMCHGPRETVQATIGEVLQASYPDDRAVGFAPGDLRGWFWAEVEAR
jgi:hypothetical protein